MASFGHQCRQAKHPAQLSNHTGLSPAISMFPIGQILSQTLQPLQSSLAVNASESAPFSDIRSTSLSALGIILKILGVKKPSNRLLDSIAPSFRALMCSHTVSHLPPPVLEHASAFCLGKRTTTDAAMRHADCKPRG